MFFLKNMNFRKDSACIRGQSQTKRAKDIKRIHRKGNSNSNKLMKKGSTSLTIKEKPNRVKQEAFGPLRLAI